MSTSRPQSRSVAVPVLEPVLSTRYALSWQQTLCVVPLVVLFLYISHLPLAPAVWNSVRAGEQLLADETGTRFTHAITKAAGQTSGVAGVPLTAGAESFSLGWLSDVLSATAHRLWGPAGIAGLSAVVITLTSVLWIRTLDWFVVRRRMAFAGLGVIVLAWWREFDAAGAGTLGALCLALFCGTLFHPTRERLCEKPLRDVWTQWAGLTALMCLWCNFSPTFLIGLAILLCMAIERAFVTAAEYRSEGRSGWRACGDPAVQRAFWLLDAAALATLVNPMGYRLWTTLFRTESNPFASEFGGFAPLQLASFSGLIIVLLCLAFAGAIRHRTLHTADALLMGAGLLAVACNEQLLVWFAPLGVLIVARAHANRVPVAKPVHEEPLPKQDEQPPLQFAWSLVCLLLIWCGFALSPFADPVLANKSRPREQWLSKTTPIGVAAFLREHPHDGLMWAPATWGDWLLLAGPADTTVFAQSDFDLLSQPARRDYARIFRGEPDWLRAADRYAVRTLVVDKSRQTTLATEIRKSSDWQLRFEDHHSMVLTRRDI